MVCGATLGDWPGGRAVLKSHSQYCPFPEHTRTDMCTSILVNPFLPLHSLGQPSPIWEDFHTFIQHRWIQRDSSWGSWCLSRWCTVNSLEKTHSSMGQYRNRNPASAPAANSLQTTLESCLVNSTISFWKTSSNFIQLSNPVQLLHFLPSNYCWLISMWEMLSHKVLCPGLACRVHHCTEPPLTPAGAEHMLACGVFLQLSFLLLQLGARRIRRFSYRITAPLRLEKIPKLIESNH